MNEKKNPHMPHGSNWLAASMFQTPNYSELERMAYTTMHKREFKDAVELFKRLITAHTHVARETRAIWFDRCGYCLESLGDVALARKYYIAAYQCNSRMDKAFQHIKEAERKLEEQAQNITPCCTIL
jgi:transposase-like protein